MFDKIVSISQIIIKVVSFIIIEVVPFGRAIKDLLKKK